MRVWSFCIATSQNHPDEGRGFVRAETVADALALIDHPDANVYSCPLDVLLPDGPGPFLETKAGAALR